MLLSSGATAVWADDRADYNARAAARLVGLFQAMDRNADGLLTREESKGDLDLGPRFDAIDINRDGIVTREELSGPRNVAPVRRCFAVRQLTAGFQDRKQAIEA